MLNTAMLLAGVVILATAADPAAAAGAIPARKPNILILLADDLGYGELGCYGQQVIRTPHLDALAGKGLRFTDFYAGSAVCSPSRGVLMTGKHTGHGTIRGNNGVCAPDDAWCRVALRKSELTVAEMLKAAGYQTAFIGKWHLGIPQDVSTWAAGRGFDYAVQEQWGEKPEGGEFDERDHWVNGREDVIRYDYTQHDCLDAFRTDLALKFLDDRRDPNKPLFLFMSYRSPHAHEFLLRETERYKEYGWPEVERRHASRITMLDEQVQRLLDKLDAMGEMANTLILFTSDNGPHREGGHDQTFFHSAGELRGYKRDLYEGGVRVPCIAYWEGRIRPGRTTDFKAAFWDVMPTLAEAAGIGVPKQTDGRSFLSELLGREPAGKDSALYWEILETPKPGAFRQAARLDHWKAVRYGVGSRTQLYDLDADPAESTDVADAHPDVVERMNGILAVESVKNVHYPYSGGATEELKREEP